ncbi:MAG: flagellar biosynthetic protein FliO [Peptococcaceae bacterium]|jgi:flagellar protein FliO/FliZ|nr:flagellar biosynthetic protein FliO [Peptococcaceae bacterium]
MNSVEDQPLNFLANTPQVQTDFSWWGLFGYIIVFLFILAAALWMIRRLNRRQMKGMDSPWIRVLDRQHLGGQQMLYLVEIAGKFQVLGGSDHTLVKIAEIDDLEIIAEMITEISSRSETKPESMIYQVMQRLFYGRKRERPFDLELQRMMEDNGHADKL